MAGITFGNVEGRLWGEWSSDKVWIVKHVAGVKWGVYDGSGRGILAGPIASAIMTSLLKISMGPSSVKATSKRSASQVR